MTKEQILQILGGKFANPNDRKYWENKLKELEIKERAYQNNQKKVWRK